MTSEVVLSAAMRNNLLSLQRTQTNIDKVQGVLSTGLKVSSALDNPQNYFASQSLKNRSSDLTKLLDGIGQSIQTVKAADSGVTSLTKLVEQASSIVDSARDAITNGSKEAAVTGNVDLSGITDLTSIGGISATNSLDFAVKDADGNAVTLSSASVAIAASDSIEQLITKVNDITDTSTGKQVLKAELTSAGKLKISALSGGSYNVTFNAAAGTPGGAEDLAFASALGFSDYAKVTQTGAGNAAVEFTATANTKLVSGTFYTGTSGTLASASTALVNTRTTDGGSTARFDVGSAGDTSTIDFTINNKAAVSISFDATTSIQGLVDGINSNNSLNQYISASYDADTGQFTIEANSAQTQTIGIAINESAAGDGTAAADFDFGVDTAYVAGSAGDSEGETFVLASAASVLSQYENDYNSLMTQIDGLVSDSGYRGVNLLKGDDLNTYFNEDRSNKLTTAGTDLTSAGLGLNAADFSRIDTIESTGTEARNALTSLRSFGSTLSNSLSIIQTRQDFTSNLVSTLNEGSDKLTVADQNEEGAKLLALQTRQQLGVTSLSLASQAQQSVLRLF